MKYFIGILSIVSIIISIFYKQAILNNDTFKQKYKINLNIKNDYRHYFFLKDKNPLYVFKNDAIKKYSIYTHKNHKPNLVYANQQVVADTKYINNIQYIGSIRESFKAKFLYKELDNITNLSPYWTEIYNLWELLLPASKTYQWNINKKETWENASKLWEKWILFNCNKQKIKNILSLEDNKYLKIAYAKTWTFYEENKNPCTDEKIPENLWFNYFQYLKNLKQSVKYYKIAWFDEKALPWIIWMISVINWILWEHEKAMYMLVQKAISMYNIIKNNEKINDKELKNYKNMINNSINRALEELNFYIIEQSETKSNCNKDYNCLVKNWYIKQEIKDLQNYCIKNIHQKINSIEDIINLDVKTSLNNTKCFLLSLWESNWHIDPIRWNLKSAILKWWTYYYNDDQQTWWVGIRK